MPEELAMQLPVLKDVLDAMSIRRYELAGYEADDLIGTISRRCEAAGWECTVVTGDKDSLQHITLEGLFPCGEGAGYAGGIVSAAIDGERCAEAACQYLAGAEI